MKTTTVGVFTNLLDAEKAIEDVKTSGVAMDDISYIYQRTDDEVVVDNGNETTTIGEGAASGAATGAVIGALAGLAVATGIIPGLGAFFVAGPLATALGLSGAAATTVAGAATGAVAGGLIGALTHIGVSKEDAALYEREVQSGNVLVLAHTDTPGVAQILATHGASEIREYTQAK